VPSSSNSNNLGAAPSFMSVTWLSSDISGADNGHQGVREAALNQKEGLDQRLFIAPSVAMPEPRSDDKTGSTAVHAPEVACPSRAPTTRQDHRLFNAPKGRKARAALRRDWITGCSMRQKTQCPSRAPTTRRQGTRPSPRVNSQVLFGHATTDGEKDR
jgi:hypothetical protein